jgi:hypothetical protein
VRDDHEDQQEPSAKIALAEGDALDSAEALARAFGALVFEPTWWPPGVQHLTYHLERLSTHHQYRVSATRPDGAPIGLIGRAQDPSARLPRPTEWRAIPELSAMRGASRACGSSVQAVMYVDNQAIHLVGYASDAEVIRVATGLRRVTPDAP